MEQRRDLAAFRSRTDLRGAVRFPLSDVPSRRPTDGARRGGPPCQSWCDPTRRISDSNHRDGGRRCRRPRRRAIGRRVSTDRRRRCAFDNALGAVRRGEGAVHRLHGLARRCTDGTSAAASRAAGRYQLDRPRTARRHLSPARRKADELRRRRRAFRLDHANPGPRAERAKNVRAISLAGTRTFMR